MTLKGKAFTFEDIPERARVGMTDQEINAWCLAQSERYRVVAIDKASGESLVAEELEQRTLNTLPPAVRRAAGILMRMPRDKRLKLIAIFDRAGDLKHPFEMVDTSRPLVTDTAMRAESGTFAATQYTD